jgi:hypothetical protein
MWNQEQQHTYKILHFLYLISSWIEYVDIKNRFPAILHRNQGDEDMTRSEFRKNGRRAANQSLRAGWQHAVHFLNLYANSLWDFNILIPKAFYPLTSY